MGQLVDTHLRVANDLFEVGDFTVACVHVWVEFEPCANSVFDDIARMERETIAHDELNRFDSVSRVMVGIVDDVAHIPSRLNALIHIAQMSERTMSFSVNSITGMGSICRLTI